MVSAARVAADLALISHKYEIRHDSRDVKPRKQVDDYGLKADRHEQQVESN